MSIKVIIANNNDDILYNRLSNIFLQFTYKDKIELLKIKEDELPNLICQMNSRENLIILDSNNSVSFCANILKNSFNQMDKIDFIILVMDFKSVTNIINKKKV